MFSAIHKAGKKLEGKTIVPDATNYVYAQKNHPAQSPAGDRRSYVRAHNVDILANINGRLVQVLDISLSGVRLSNGFPLTGEKVTMSLIPKVGDRLDVNHSVTAKGSVIRIDAEDHAVAVAFDQMSYSLSKMVIAATSKRLGVKPFIVI